VHRGVEIGAWPIEIAPDLDTVDLVARMQLAARRAGCTIRLRGVRPCLHDFLVLVGLDEVLEEA